jgi:hypothetical protein
VSRDAESHVQLVHYAPAHTVGVTCVVPAGTVIVALDQVPGASGFGCYPEDYDRLEKVLIPEQDRESFAYAGFYGLSFRVREIGNLLDPLEPLDPRPPNRLLRVSGRPSPRQRTERARFEALHTRIAALEHDRIAKITDRAWVRRKRGRRGHWEVPGHEGKAVPLESWDIWLDRASGDPPREPDVVQPGSSLAATGRVWAHQAEGKNGV